MFGIDMRRSAVSNLFSLRCTSSFSLYSVQQWLSRSRDPIVIAVATGWLFFSPVLVADNNQVGIFKQALTLVRARQLDALDELVTTNPQLLGNQRQAGRLLHSAIRIADVPVARYLLVSGVNPDVRQALDQSAPLHNASILKTTALVELLVAHKADVNATDQNGRSPIFRALELQRMDIARILFAAGADLNHVDTLHGWTPLNLTVYEEKLTATKWLIAPEQF